MYGYDNRSVFIQKRKFQVSTLGGFKVMIQNVHVQFLFCNSIHCITIPYFTAGQPPASIETQLSYTYTGVSCNQDTGLQATQHVSQVLATSQCVQEGTCQDSVAHSCATSGTRRRRSVDTMTITITLFAAPTFDGSGFNIEQIALNTTTGRLK